MCALENLPLYSGPQCCWEVLVEIPNVHFSWNVPAMGRRSSPKTKGLLWPTQGWGLGVLWQTANMGLKAAGLNAQQRIGRRAQ